MKRVSPILANGLFGTLAALGLAGAGQAAGGSNAVVVTTTDDSLDAFDQQCSLREALANVNTNSVFSPVVNECAGGSAALTDVIVLGSGAEYNLTVAGAGDDAGDLDIVDGLLPMETVDLRIETDGDAPASIDQNVVGERVLEIHAATVELDNVVIRDGGLDGSGGGILNDGGMLAMERVRVIGNSANTGGGLYNGGTAIIRNSELQNNGTFLAGGAIYNASTARLEVHDTLLQANEATSGAGIFNDGGSLLVRGSELNVNVASGGGGAIAAADGAGIVVEDSHFGHNQAVHGGAIHAPHDFEVQVGHSHFEGNSATVGGAMRAARSQVNYSVFRNNSAVAGGAISAEKLRVTRSVFEENEALLDTGGAIAASGLATVTTTRFTGNRARRGGAIAATTAEIHYVEMRENEASELGGGLWVASTVEILGSRFTHNSAGTDGGGVYIDYTGPAQGSLISRSLFAHNQANGHGGGLWLDGEISLGNTTISGNGASAGGGLFINEGAFVEAWHVTLANNVQGQDLHKMGSLTLQNSIISTPGQDDCTVSLENVTIESLGNNIADDASCFGLDQAGDMNSTDPLLAPLAYTSGDMQTHALLPGSPAIDMANAVACANEPIDSIDQRGGARPAGAGCDIGAHEQGAEVSLTMFFDGFEVY